MSASPGRGLTQDDLSRTLAYFWHPVATVDELAARPGGVAGVRLLGRDLAVARLPGGAVAALVDRCPHRSTRLSAGLVDGDAIRCAYHGWRWAADGSCIEIPSAPELPIPGRFCQQAFTAEIRHGLVWVRLDDRFPTTIPPLPAAEDPGMRVVTGEPYTWPTAAPRRVENFVDLAHFAWVHDGSLGRRDRPVAALPPVARVAGELRFSFEPATPETPEETALVGPSTYRMPMPLTVDIGFDIAGRPGVRRHLWMTASPVDPGTCRSFWSIARNDSLDDDDQVHLDFQRLVLAEDEPVVCSQVPAPLPLTLAEELHVASDRVSVEYRRWLLELTEAAAGDGARFEELLGLRLAAGMT